MVSSDWMEEIFVQKSESIALFISAWNMNFAFTSLPAYRNITFAQTK
jgi:hypothetical protein